MAPPRRIVRPQLDMLINFLEENQDAIHGGPQGGTSIAVTRKKWMILAKKLNSVQGGTMKTPEAWKKYWFEWRHKCRKKAADTRRYDTEAYKGRNRFIPLNDLEVRVLELCGKVSSESTVGPSVSHIENDEEYLHDGLTSDSVEPLDVKDLNTPIPKSEKSSTWKSINSTTEANTERVSPPPSWVLNLEERKILTEERTADALESIVSLMRNQEERRNMIEVRIADALTAVAGTLQDLNSGIQEAIQHLQQLHPIQTEWSSLKRDIL